MRLLTKATKLVVPMHCHGLMIILCGIQLYVSIDTTNELLILDLYYIKVYVVSVQSHRSGSASSTPSVHASFGSLSLLEQDLETRSWKDNRGICHCQTSIRIG